MHSACAIWKTGLLCWSYNPLGNLVVAVLSAAIIAPGLPRLPTVFRKIGAPRSPGEGRHGRPKILKRQGPDGLTHGPTRARANSLERGGGTPCVRLKRPAFLIDEGPSTRSPGAFGMAETRRNEQIARSRTRVGQSVDGMPGNHRTKIQQDPSLPSMSEEFAILSNSTWALHEISVSSPSGA